MAKVGSLQQGYVGKLDGQCYFKGADGVTQVRKITTPKNPKTLQQRVQRVIAKTVNAHYKVMKAIADHSFEGRTMGFQCMNRFKQSNLVGLRSRAGEIQNSGNSLYDFYNFMPLGSQKFMPAAVIIAEGQLTKVVPTIAQSTNHYVGRIAVSGNTYADVINSLGAHRGDQMTLCTVEKDLEGDYTFHFARIILDPRNADGSGAELSSEFITNYAVNKPSARNNGSFVSLAYNAGQIEFRLAHEVAAVAVIMSRRSGDNWLRSNAKFVISESCIGNDKCSLLLAAESDGKTVLDLDSEAYLNNAGTGGAAGQTESPADPTDPTQNTPTLSNTVYVNGASQSRSGGSANVTTLSSFALTGSNLQDQSFSMKKNGGAAVQPSSQLASRVTWNIEGAAVGETYTFYEGETLVFTVNVIDGSNSGGNGFQEGD